MHKSLLLKLTQASLIEIFNVWVCQLDHNYKINLQAMGKRRSIYKKQEIPFFVKKLLGILENPANKEVVSWSESGSGFTIHNQSQLTNRILPIYFKHHNLASFIRQLNLYGFHKMENASEYFHENFKKSQPEEMKMIKRIVKTKKKKVGSQLKQRQQMKLLNHNKQEFNRLAKQNENLKVEYKKLVKVKNESLKTLRKLRTYAKKSRKLTEKAPDSEMKMEKQQLQNQNNIKTDSNQGFQILRKASSSQFNRFHQTNPPLGGDMADDILNSYLQ